MLCLIFIFVGLLKLGLKYGTPIMVMYIVYVGALISKHYYHVVNYLFIGCFSFEEKFRGSRYSQSALLWTSRWVITNSIDDTKEKTIIFLLDLINISL